MNFRPFSLQLGLSMRPSPALAQPAGLEPASTPREPSLDRALASLSSDEQVEYRGWGAKEKVLFLSAYQWISVAAAQGLHRVDGSPYEGFLPEGVSQAFGALSAMAPYLKDSPALAQGADQTSTILQEATQKTQPQADGIAKKYRLLRDRVAWEIAVAGGTIQYEVVGDDPGNPGVIYTRKIGEDKTPDFAAIFSGNTPREWWKSGLALEDQFAAAGVTFRKLDLSGANPRLAAGAPQILAILITVLVAILAFFWLYNHVMQTKKLTQIAVDLISQDPKLSGAEKAALIEKLKSSNSFFDDIFGNQFPWTTVLIGATLVGIAYFVLPSLLLAYTSKPAYQPRGASA
jgi:hypothetical protein